MARGQGTNMQSRFGPSAIDDGTPKAKARELNWAGLDEISDMIAQAAGSSSQSQPDASKGTAVGPVDNSPRLP